MRILDCGDGPSSFAAEGSRNGRYVVAADPMYRFSARDFLADSDLTTAQIARGNAEGAGQSAAYRV